MNVGVKAGSVVVEIGSADFLHAFFATISENLEPGGWGTRFPQLMNHLYKGELSGDQSGTVLEDLKVIRKELSELGTDKLALGLDSEDTRQAADIGINLDSKRLDECFITVSGKNLFDVLFECLEYTSEENIPTVIKRVPSRQKPLDDKSTVVTWTTTNME